MCVDLSTDIVRLHQSLSNLAKKGFLWAEVLPSEDSDIITVVVKDHYKQMAKSKANIRKAITEGKEASPTLKAVFRTFFSPSDFIGKDSFKAPTPKEVADYALSEGYLINGKTFVDYYSENDWFDKNNKKVRNWKAKLLRVWCREDDKLVKNEDAPYGWEYFFIEMAQGERVAPESWKDGIPQHGNFMYAQHLIERFNELKNS